MAAERITYILCVALRWKHPSLKKHRDKLGPCETRLFCWAYCTSIFFHININSKEEPKWNHTRAKTSYFMTSCTTEENISKRGSTTSSMKRYFHITFTFIRWGNWALCSTRVPNSNNNGTRYCRHILNGPKCLVQMKEEASDKCWELKDNYPGSMTTTYNVWRFSYSHIPGKEILETN